MRGNGSQRTGRQSAGHGRPPARRLVFAGIIRSWRWLTGLVVAGILVGLAPASAHAAQIRSGDAIVVGPNDTIDDDLYAVGRFVVVQGRVNGDVLALGETVTVSGTVAGNVMAAGRTVGLGGQVDGSARVAGDNITIDGRIGKDLVAGSRAVLVPPSGSIGRDVLAGTDTTSLNGAVGRNVLAGAGTVVLGAPVGGEVRLGVGQLRVTDSAVVGGDLIYESENEAMFAPRARVEGRIERRVPERREARPGPLDPVVAWLRALVGLFALGLLVVLLFPGFSRRTVEVLRASPWGSLGVGFAVLVGTPFVAAFVFGVGLIVGGWWLGLIALALYPILLAVSLSLAGLFVGRWLLERVGRPGVHRVWALLLGLVLLLVVGLVPYVGPLLVAVLALFALGGLTRALVTGRELAAPPTVA